MEIGWHEKWVDMQLAHQEYNKTRRAYSHAKYLPQPGTMMQAWADYLDALRAHTDITLCDSQRSFHISNRLVDMVNRISIPLFRRVIVPFCVFPKWCQLAELEVPIHGWAPHLTNHAADPSCSSAATQRDALRDRWH